MLIFAIIFVTKVYIINNEKLEHLTTEGDDIQKIATVYDKDELSVGKLQLGAKWIMPADDNATAFKVGKADGSGLANFQINNLNAATTKVNKLKLGDKWLFAGTGDASANDDWLRLYKTDGSAAYYGGLAAGRLYDARIGDVSGLKGTLDGINGRLGSLSAAVRGYRCADYGLPGGDCFNIGTTDLDTCAAECKKRWGNSMCAQTRANDQNDKTCCCRGALGYINDGNWQSKLLV